ncbi:MerR family transcriptional regulator [Paenibacillus herberti]|uniref:MerR family transcriptional regulator n=1 Tax=Paenibacillus herberti TaxID=1619309 RepID=A0A229P0I8_9BACL|nr:MerR family transcriptional regulator [Paenibacillus herberti]OXM15753.1 MerR family transcriptional regulator [Paenibacillus herberti]
MKISQIAKLTGTSARSVRYYEKKGLLTASRQDNNYRDFDDSIVELINTIQMYLGLGLTTEQIKTILYCEHPEMAESEQNGKKDEYCEELLLHYEAKLIEVIEQKKTMDEVQKRLEKQIKIMKEHQDKWL